MENLPAPSQIFNNKHTMENVPVINLAGDTDTAVATLDSALRHFGFFYVENHGIDAQLIEKQFQVAANLFALPEPEKRAMPFDPHLDIGYVGSGVQNLDPDGKVQHTGDTKEQFMMTNNKLITDTATGVTCTLSSSHIDPNNIFEGSVNFRPTVPDHAATTREYASKSYHLNQRLNSLLFLALGLDETTQTTLGSEPFLVLKQMRYAGDPSDPARGKFGAGAHADWGSFTILATDQTPGLQIQMGDVWLPVPPKPNCLIINSGDQIAQLTNDVYRSAIHRVVTTSTTKPRFSTAVFTYFGIQACPAPLPQFVSEDRPSRYPYGRTTNQYFHFKLQESMGTTSGY
jgi:isopenicillin N synthase-like dioxygenase